MANDQELKYKITTEADVAGATAAADAIGKVDKAATGTASSATSAAKSLNQTGEVAEKLRGGATVVGEVLRGNLRALAQFPAVLKGIGAAVAANPLFAIATVAGLLVIPALQKIKDGWAAAGKAAEEAGKRSSDALSAARQAISERRGNETAERFREIERAAEEAERAIRRTTQAEIERVDAAEAVALAEFNARAKAQGLDEVQTARGVAGIRETARRRRDDARLVELDRLVANRERELADKRNNAATAAETEAFSRAQIRQIESRTPGDIRRDLDLERQRVLSLQIDRAAAPQTGADLAKINADLATASQRRADLQLELERAEQNYQAALDKATAQLEQNRAKREDADKAVEAAERNLANVRADADAQRSSITLGAQRDQQVREVERFGAVRSGRSLAAGLNEGPLDLQAPGREQAPQPIGPAIIEYNGQVLAYVRGVRQQNQADIDAVRKAIDAVKRENETLKARVENLGNAQR